jgi:predicted permease
MWTNLRLGVRRLVKDRGVSAAAICALALALTAVNTIFSLANGIFLRPLPFEDPERIVLLGTTRTTGGNRIDVGLSYADWQDWRASTSTLSSLAVFTEDTVNLADDRVAPERLYGAIVSANTFSTIGRQPLLGRDFAAADDMAGAPLVVLLGHRVWQGRYGGDAGVVGRTVRVNGRLSTVVGVMPPGFAFPQTVDIWQPLAALPDTTRSARAERFLEGIGRMRPGVSRAQAAADLGAIAAGIASRDAATSAGVAPRVRDFRDRSVGRVRVVLTAFGLAVTLVLLVACANVANLLLARGLDRGREMSIRLSMGASRGRLIAQLLGESTVLGAAAGVLGLALSMVAVAAFRGALDAAGDVPYFIDFSMDWRVVTFLAGLTLAASMAFGLMPALHTSRAALSAVLADAGRASTGGPRNRRWHGGLVVAQVALAIVLLTAAGLTIRDLQAQTRVDVGIDSRGVTTARLTLPDGRYATPESRAAFYARLDARLATLTAGKAVLATYPPTDGGERREVGIDGRTAETGRPPVSMLAIGPRYFASLHSRPVRGREFADEDAAGVAVVNERFARLYFGDTDPLGHSVSMRVGGRRDEPVQRFTIVGVAPNVRQRSTADRDFDPVVYVPQQGWPFVYATILMRSDAATGTAAAALRDTIGALDPDLPLFDMRSLDDVIDEERWEGRVMSTVFGLVALLALTLATVGVYAVTAFAVSRRTREIGVRMALGARAGHIYALVTRGAALQVTVGIALGLLGAFGVRGVLDAILSEIDATDAVTLAAAPVLLACVTVIACLVPAARAAAVDPARSLRAE